MPVRSIQDTNFHEAGLTGIERPAPRTVCLLLEGVQVDGQLRDASVWLKDVRQIVRDGLPVADFVMEHDDAEVLTLEEVSDSVHLIVEWNDFENHRHATKSYHITCQSADVEVT